MSEDLDRAILLAAKLHSGQVRDGERALPYIVHPIEVLSNLRYVGGVVDEDMLIAAALHDTVEESGVDLAELGREFGPRVESLVKELTREEPPSAQAAGLSPGDLWTLRSNMLLGEIAKMSNDAQAIKLADRLSNVKEGIRTKKGRKLERYLSQTREILKIVPRKVNPGLWKAIQASLPPKS